MSHVLPALLVAAALMPALTHAEDCKFSEQRDFDVDAASLKTLALDLGASDATIEGVAGLTKVEVRGRICASSKEGLAPFQVEHKREGDRLIVTARHQSSAVNISIGGVRYAGLKLAVRVPSALAVVVKAAAGDVDVRGVAALDFDTDAGDLNVNDVSGEVRLRLDAGDVKGGKLGSLHVLSSAAGDIALSGVRGDVAIDDVSTGDVVLEDIGGSVAVKRLETGDLHLRHVARDVRVESMDTGDLQVEDVGGDLTVRSHGMGDISHSGVRGKIDIPRESDD